MSVETLRERLSFSNSRISCRQLIWHIQIGRLCLVFYQLSRHFVFAKHKPVKWRRVKMKRWHEMNQVKGDDRVSHVMSCDWFSMCVNNTGTFWTFKGTSVTSGVVCVCLFYNQTLVLFRSQDGLRRLSGNEYILSTKRESFWVSASQSGATPSVSKGVQGLITGCERGVRCPCGSEGLCCASRPSRASSHPQSPDHSSVAERRPPSHRSNHGERGLVGLWHLQFGGRHHETVRPSCLCVAGGGGA